MSWSVAPEAPERMYGPSWTTSSIAEERVERGSWFALLEKAVQLRGDGMLNAVLSPHIAIGADLDGAGELVPTPAPREFRHPFFNGPSFTTAEAFEIRQRLASLTGDGQFDASSINDGLSGIIRPGYGVNFTGGGELVPGVVGGHQYPDGLSAELIQRYLVGGGVAPLHLDDFDRSDSTTGLGSNWTNRAGVMGISGNAAYGVTGGIWNVASYNTPATTDDMEASITLGSPTGADYAMVGIGGNASGEMVFVDNAAYDGHFHIYSVTDWGFGGLVDQANGGGGWTTGDVLKLKRVGNVYTAYLNEVSTGVTWTDSGNVVPRDASHRLVSIGAYDDGSSGSRRIDSFDASPVGVAPGAPLFSGEGQLRGFAGSFSFMVADLIGSGALTTAAPKQIYPLMAQLAANGTLSATTFTQYQKLVDLLGSGTLSATLFASYLASLGVSGAGALTALLLASYQQTGTTGGTGTVTALISQRYTLLVDLLGGGTLTGAIAGLVPGEMSADFSGDGTLAATVEGHLTSMAPDLSGAGALSAIMLALYQQLAALRGSGALDATTLMIYQRLMTLAGSGTLTADLALIFASAMGLSGAGTLTAPAKASYQQSANLSGDGTSSATWMQRYPMAVPFSGGSALVCDAYNAQLPDGLSAVVWERYLYPVAFTGPGQLTAAMLGIQAVIASLSGSGVLSAVTPQQIYSLMANMVANGTLSATTVQGATVLANLLGTGTISATAFATYLSSLGVSGAGALTAFLLASYQQSASSGGVGTVTALISQLYSLTPQLSGGGTLSAITPVAQYACSAPLSGDGTLSATATQVAFPTITNITTSPFHIGDTITLTGTGFVVGTSGAVTVTVGGVAATSVNVTSSTSLTCVVPSVTLGAQNVVVTAASGASSPFSITVVAVFTPFNETNTARTNQTVPAGTTGVWVTLLGAGGGGGLCGTGSNLQAHAGGGGAGGAAKVGRSFVGVASLGATYSVVRPLGAASNTAGAAAVFSSGSVVLTANGGGAGGNGSGNTAGTAGAGGTATQSGISGMTLINGTAGSIGGTSGVAAVAAVNNTAGAGPGGGGGGGHNAAGSNFDGGAGGNSVNVTGGAAGQNGNNPGGAGTNGAAGQPGGGGGGGGGSSNGTANGSLGGKGGTYGAGGGGVGSGQFVGTGGAGGDSWTLLEWV